MISPNPTDNITTVSFHRHGKDISLKGISESDWIFNTIKTTYNFYEIELLKYIRHSLRWKKGAAIDVGANIGNHSVFFGLFVAKSVICFEPNPEILATLRRNLTENHITYKLYECGLGETKTRGDIVIPHGFETNIGAARLITSNKTSDGVLVLPLDSLLPEINKYLNGLPIIAIKIDVEGMELAVIRGARILIETHRPELFVEIANDHQMNKIESILLEMGYSKVISYAATPVWHFTHKSRSKLYFLWLKMHSLARFLTKCVGIRLLQAI